MSPRGVQSYARRHPSHSPAVSIVSGDVPRKTKSRQRKTQTEQRRSLSNIFAARGGRGQRVLASSRSTGPISRLLIFGRFLAVATNVTTVTNLTERRFRAYWDRTAHLGHERLRGLLVKSADKTWQCQWGVSQSRRERLAPGGAPPRQRGPF